MTVTLSNELPAYPTFVEGIRRAPDRGYRLTPAQTETALRNALRYIPEELHARLAPEFMDELLTRGKIYGYRFRPQGDLKAKPIDEYKGNCIEGKAFQVMIDNNLYLILPCILTNWSLTVKQDKYAKTGCNTGSLNNIWK